MSEQRFVGTRLFDGVRDIGPFHLYPNKLEGRGATTELHEHPHDHVAVFDCSIPGAVYAVDAILPNGKEIAVEMKQDSGIGVYALIAARVKHRIYLRQGDRGEFCCMFSHYDENGRYLPDPKVA